MRTIRIDNPVLDSYVSDLGADYVTGGVGLTVRNNNSFADDDLVVVGNPGEELSEGKKVASVSGSTVLTLDSTLNFDHNKGTPIYKTLWDFVSIEGRSSSVGVFAVLTQSGIQWDSLKNKTIYQHSDGTDTWEYRFRFYNSVTTLYSEYSPTLTGAGFTKHQMGYIIRGSRRIAGDKEGEAMSIDELLQAATRAKNIIRAHNPRFWFWKVDGFQTNTSIAATSGNNVFSLSSITDLGTVNYIEYVYSQGNVSERCVLREKPDVQFLEITRDQNRPEDDYPFVFRLLPPDDNSDKGYFEIDRKIKNSGVGTFYVSYYKEESDYNSVDDTTAIIIPEILQDYLIAEIFETKGIEAKAEKYYKMFAGPQARKKTFAIEDLSGIALLDELDRQYKRTQGQPKSLVNFRGQKAMSRLYGSRRQNNADYIRENYFDGIE